jgi:hypothetical protein
MNRDGLARWRPYTVSLHCWEPGPDGHTTCTLPDGHIGAHDYTPDHLLPVHLNPENDR